MYIEISKNHKDLSVIINNGGITQDNLILRMNSNNGLSIKII